MGDITMALALKFIMITEIFLKLIISGREIVNKNHPEVIEIWNIVFIKYNRSLAGKLSDLSTLYIDTGMGLGD